MKAIAANIHTGISTGTLVKVDDNSGAKLLRVLSKARYKGVRGRRPTVGVADIFQGAVVEGKPDMRKKIMRAVLVRQKKEFRRHTGERVKFEDNSCVLITDKNEPQATEVKGVIAREVAERFPKIATIAKNVI